MITLSEQGNGTNDDSLYQTEGRMSSGSVKRWTVLAGLALLGAAALTTPAQAAYMLLPQSDGAASLSLAPGGSFTLDLVLSSDAADINSSALFTVEFSKPGLQYTAYTWGSPYAAGTQDDLSSPAILSLPAVLNADTYVAGFGDPGAVDVYFENFAPSGDFTTGTIVSLSLTVPAGYEPGEVQITAVTDTFDNGVEAVTTTGGSFTLNVVPEPSTIGLGGVAALGLLLRRRRRSDTVTP